MGFEPHLIYPWTNSCQRRRVKSKPPGTLASQAQSNQNPITFQARSVLLKRICIMDVMPCYAVPRYISTSLLLPLNQHQHRHPHQTAMKSIERQRDIAEAS